MKCHLFLMGLAVLSIRPISARAADGEERFASAQAAVSALVSAAATKDTNALRVIFGPEIHDLVSPDAVQASNSLSNFSRRLGEKVEQEKQSESRIILQIGLDGWPFPIPLAQESGQWFFDTAAGKEEILSRRVGTDELQAIQVCHAYVEAQREYASRPRNGDGVIEYAQHLRSTTNTHDGLYWRAADGEEASPFGPLIAESHEEGYRHASKIMGENLAPYRGYYFKILTQQGSHAPGGKYKYLINGHMVAGFALVAWPAEWNNSGVMTFIVNQEGKVFQKNLGARTSTLAGRITSYDPDATWTAAEGE